MRVVRSVRRLVGLLVFGLVVEYLVLPQIAGIRRSLSLIAHARPLLLGAAVVAEAASIWAYAQLTRSMLPAEGRPRVATTLRINLSTLAISHLVPGGSAVGTGIGYRLMTEAGVEAPDAGFALGMQGIGSAIVLNVVLWLALVVSIPLHGFNPLYTTAAAVGAVLIGAFSALVVLLTRGEALAARVLRTVARRLPFLHEEAMHQLVHRLAARLRSLISDRALLWRAVGWAAANWILDAASLWAFVAAFGVRADPDALLVAYGLANVLAAIPVTPGGLGVVEAVLTSTLVGFGVPQGPAILGVISYRLLNFWAPIPVGGLAYLSLRGRPDAGAREKVAQLERVAERALLRRDTVRAWARRHGLRSRSQPPPESPERAA